MNMRRLAFGLLLTALGTHAIAACGGLSENAAPAGGDGTDSNTHWLGRCTADADCMGELECVCGVCSMRCDEPAACDELGANAECVQALCETDSQQSTGLCSKGCERDAECPDDGSCEQGVCVPANASLRQAPTETDTEAEGGEAGIGAPIETGNEIETEAGTGAPTKPPPAIPEGCEFLLERDPSRYCGDFDERCDQMQEDGQMRAFECYVHDGYSGVDGEYVTVTESQLDARVDCVAQWLELLGAQGVREENINSVLAEGSWDSLSGLADLAPVQCYPTCADETCNYCYELTEPSCAGDPFCYAVNGVPIDEDAQCLEPSGFALCAPGDRLCDDAETTARDAAGQCWHFGSICYDPGFAYFDDNGDGSCRSDYAACGAEPVTPPVPGCEAQDARSTGAMCEAQAGYVWNGSQCEPLTCDCEGEDCDLVRESREACEASWAGCIDSIEFCTVERVPYATAASFRTGSPLSAPDPSLADWTATVWSEPFELPIEPIACPEVEGFEGLACGDVKGLTFTEGFVEPLRVDLMVPAEAWSRIDVTPGAAIELRITESEFSVRSADNQLPLILVGIGPLQSGPSTAEWAFVPLKVATGAPFCKRLDEDEPDCNWLHVQQKLVLSAPQDSPPNQSGERPQQVLTLDPFRAAEITVGTDVGSVNYHVMHGRSSYMGSERPSLGSCGAIRAREDGFSVVRVTP